MEFPAECAVLPKFLEEGITLKYMNIAVGVSEASLKAGVLGYPFVYVVRYGIG